MKKDQDGEAERWMFFSEKEIIFVSEKLLNEET